MLGVHRGHAFRRQEESGRGTGQDRSLQGKDTATYHPDPTLPGVQPLFPCVGPPLAEGAKGRVG